PLPEQVEAAAYYVVAEAVANVQKHASAKRVVVRAVADGSELVVEVVDDGVGGADHEGTGLRGLEDRIGALGGRLTLDSPRGGGTRIRAEIPTAQRPLWLERRGQPPFDLADFRRQSAGSAPPWYGAPHAILAAQRSRNH